MAVSFNVFGNPSFFQKSGSVGIFPPPSFYDSRPFFHSCLPPKISLEKYIFLIFVGFNCQFFSQCAAFSLSRHIPLFPQAQAQVHLQLLPPVRTVCGHLLGLLPHPAAHHRRAHGHAHHPLPLSNQHIPWHDKVLSPQKK